MMNPGSKIENRGSKIENRGGRIEDQFSITDPRSSILDPRVRIPAGWARVRFKMFCPDRAHVEILMDTGRGFNAAECLERVGFRGLLERDFFVNLPRPVVDIRFHRCDCPSNFRLEKFQIRPISRLGLVGYSLRNIVRAGPTALAGPAWSLVRGRWGQFKRFLLQNVPGPSALAPPPYDPDQAYAEWRKQRQWTEADRQGIRAWISRQQKLPLISVIVPTTSKSPVYLSSTIESIRKQAYPRWELWLIAPACGSDGRETTSDDPRIQIVPQKNLQSAICNLPLGEYFTLLTPGDELAEHALFHVAQAVVAEPDLDMLYSDEDQIDGQDRHVSPFFKPDWSPETLRSFHYTGGLAVYRTDLMRELGFKLDEQIQEYDLALQIAGRSSRIKHLADVLYHRRRPITSGERRGVSPTWITSDMGTSQSKSGLRPDTRLSKVTILIPTAYQADFLTRCLESTRKKTTYPNYEILVLDNNKPPPGILDSLQRWGINRVPYDLPFNWARTMNQGVATAQGEHLLILDDDTEVITPDWIERLLEYSQQEEIGVVGARLQFPDGRLQHAGVTILDGTPGHPFYGYPEDHPGYFYSSALPRNYSAVTGACLMTRADVFRSVGGFDETFATNFNDIDYCLRVRRKGLRVVCNPVARLIHHETATKTAYLPDELAAFKKRWKEFQDPYSNPNLSKRFHDFRIEN
jgi:GT2 family glycosyltransferase